MAELLSLELSPTCISPTRIALGIEYDGSMFNGWQTQLNPHLRTVQETLERALSQVASQPITVQCAGRTDAGVHACGQVVHFDTNVQRLLKAWVMGSNTILPPQVAVRWAQPVPDKFHARFSAVSRRYRYLIANTPTRPAMFGSFLTYHSRPLDAVAMQAAGQLLLGEHDFTSYRGASCQSRTPMRNVKALCVQRQGDFLSIEIEANAFLLHMVRNIVGTLIQIGEHRKPPQWAGELLTLRDRTKAAPTASPKGLALMVVRYPDEYQIPASTSPVFTPILPI
jgi:tRNA pseudouridine38-40 synthase